ncbi:MAG: nitrogenase iron protein, partial [Selenomonas sp.]|nr:nitrogenase iron protein [Selenomonas sp.]
RRVCQIGCDPKNDSTRLLLGHIAPSTILDLEREKKGAALTLDEIVHEAAGGVHCIEAGGPDPGVGCAGRGIIVALERLKALHAFDDLDVVLYDVLGDVVCGGFAVPIREGYAEEIYIVSSGELMSLYAANNIAKGVCRFAARGAVKLGGIIGNGRDVHNERELLAAFAARIGTQLIAYIPRSAAVHEAEIHRQTLIAYAPESEQAQYYKELAHAIDTNEMLTVPTPMAFEELEELVESYGD